MLRGSLKKPIIFENKIIDYLLNPERGRGTADFFMKNFVTTNFVTKVFLREGATAIEARNSKRAMMENRSCDQSIVLFKDRSDNVRSPDAA